MSSGQQHARKFMMLTKKKGIWTSSDMEKLLLSLVIGASMNNESDKIALSGEYPREEIGKVLGHQDFELEALSETDLKARLKA